MDLGEAAGSLRAGLANEKRDDRRSLLLRVDNAQRGQHWGGDEH